VAGPDTTYAIVTAISSAGRSWRLPVISTTMTVTDMGSLPAAPKTASTPTIAKGTGDWTSEGASICISTPKSSPVAAPTNIPGAKTPPLPPDPTVREVAAILAKGSAARIRRPAPMTIDDARSLRGAMALLIAPPSS
jgi:hypothetical protein